jgi:hypothetical protein
VKSDVSQFQFQLEAGAKNFAAQFCLLLRPSSRRLRRGDGDDAYVSEDQIRD